MLARRFAERPVSTTQILHCKLRMVIGSARRYVEGFMYTCMMCCFVFTELVGGLGLVLIDNFIELMYGFHWHFITSCFGENCFGC